MKRLQQWVVVLSLAIIGLCAPRLALAQGQLGSVTGTVYDPSGAVIPGVKIVLTNPATGFSHTGSTNGAGSYQFFDLPIGTYTVQFSKTNFKTEVHTSVIVQGNRTATVDATLQVGTSATTITVHATPLMNKVNTTNGYVVGQLTIRDTPLGTGSFTQLAILSPGVHADFLGGNGANAGLGNQAIFSNGNRDTSNSFSLNGVSTNNLFNGNSTSQVGENRFVLNTGENFGSGGVIQTSTSVYAAIGQALPTPPTDAIQEITVDSSMYDATQGNNSGAHILVQTKSGTNHIHGSAWENWQNSDMMAAPFFYNASPAITDKVPFLNRNMFGATIGGPIMKNKLFYFGSYEGTRVSDASESTQDVTVPLGLTNDRSMTGLTATANSYINEEIIAGGGSGVCGTSGNPACFSGTINPAAYNLLNAKGPNGQYLIPSAQISNPATATFLGYDAVVQGPNSTANVDQGIINVDYTPTARDRISEKLYLQNNPTTNPFGSVGSLLGFGQRLQAGSDVASLSNTLILSPTVTWEQRVGFARLRAYSQTSQAFSPSALGMNLLTTNKFPQFEIGTMDPLIASGIEFGPSASFGNAGFYQNAWQLESSLNMVVGRNTLAFGGEWDHTQLNIINNNTGTDTVVLTSFMSLLQGSVRGGDMFQGSASRYYRANTTGLYANDNFKLRKNVTITAGLRWDDDGPFTEKYGRLAAFNPSLYSYNVASDTITNSGLEIAKNGSDSLMLQHQWMFSPRIGIAWSPVSKLTFRTGYGLYADRGEFFSYFSPPAGAGFNGPFGVTLAPPFVEPITSPRGSTLSAPFGTTPPPPPLAATSANFLGELPNLSQTACGFSGCWPAGNLFGPVLFGGYDIGNKLPYTESWTADIQYQLSNNWLLDIGYAGNRGLHEILPIPFNQPRIATPQNPLWSQNPANEQIYSYGGTPCYGGEGVPCQYPNCCSAETVFTNEFSGNAPVRVLYPGYDMNSALYEAEGVSNYAALQAQIRKRISHGLQFTASYTYSHVLDMQSGLGLFFTGNNPQIPQSNYASADFDQTHVLTVNYSYTVPAFDKGTAFGKFINNWVIGGQTVAESGQPYSVYDFSGSVASLYLGTSDYIGNPIVPLKQGVSASQAQLQGTTGVNPGKPVLNPNDFLPQFVAPGTNGVPPCDSSGCDLFESLYGTSGRNMFRGPFQVRFDMSLARQFHITEKYLLRVEADGFNLFNHPDFDAPNNNVTFFPNFTGPPSIPPEGSLGVIQHTIGSSRFFQLAMHLYF